jgi:hypothetical protein
MGRLGRLGLEPAQRYERERPGELLHIDVKKLGRIHGVAGKRITGHRHYTPQKRDAAGVDRRTVGWEYVHVCIDDATRLAYVEVFSDEKTITVVGFLRRAIKHLGSYGITVERLITDNGSPTAPPHMPSPAARSGSVTYAPGPTDPRPTERRSDLSAPC